MSEYLATVLWQRNNEEDFSRGQYSRGHEWHFDGGVIVPASSSPHVVPIPYSLEENVDPEEAFVASLSSCHMLFFLSIAGKKRFVIDRYEDKAIGFMESDANGRLWMSRVILRPQVKFSGARIPSMDVIENIHHLAHQQCFIANSVKTEVTMEILN